MKPLTLTHPASSDHSFSPVWLLRGLPLLAALGIAVAMLVPSTNFWHGFALGGALGLLIGLSAYTFNIESVSEKPTTYPSDVHPYKLT